MYVQVVRITDRANPGIRPGSESRLEYHSLTSNQTRSNQKSDLWNFEMNISMRGGLCYSFSNSIFLLLLSSCSPLPCVVFLSRFINFE